MLTIVADMMRSILMGLKKPYGQERSSYSYAQKMQASMTYAFGCVWKLGVLPWHQNETTGW